MNIYNAQGYMVEITGKIKQKLALLTGNELLLQEGMEEEELGILQKKLGKTQKEIRNLIEKAF